MAVPSISYRCSNAGCRSWIRTDVNSPAIGEVRCARCAKSINVKLSPGQTEGRPIDCCALCGGPEFFIRKDFPQKIGMALVVAFGLIATAFFYFENVPATFVTLAALVVVDVIIYFFIGKVVVCYRCRAEYRGFDYDPGLEGFDLATSEKYAPAAWGTPHEG